MWDVNYELTQINDALATNDYSLGENEIGDAEIEDELNNLAENMNTSSASAVDKVDDSYLLDMELNIPSTKVGGSSSKAGSAASKMSEEDRELEKALGL